MDKKIGHYAFLAGVLIAFLAALMQNVIPVDTTAIILVVLGIIVGFMNITAKETDEFLIAAIALMVAGALPAISTISGDLGIYLNAILGNITIFVAPAVLVVAFKTIYELAER